MDEARAKNSEKAQAEADRGPARREPDATPIGDAIEAFHRRGDIAFGIPAHRSGAGGVEPIAARWGRAQAFRADVGMNKGADNRNQSWQVEPTAMQLFARAVGADETLFSTNGSTENVHVAMMAGPSRSSPGELFNAAIVDYLQRLAAEGVMVEGRPTSRWPNSARWQGMEAPLADEAGTAVGMEADVEVGARGYKTITDPGAFAPAARTPSTLD